MWKYFIISSIATLFLFSLWILIYSEDQVTAVPRLVAVPFEKLENWSQDQQSEAFLAYQKSCAVFLAKKPMVKISPLSLGGTAGDWQESCYIAKNNNILTDRQARQFFEDNFTVFSYSQDVQGLFTGYFAPEYLGSPKPTKDYSYPLYRVPDDLKILKLGQFSSALKGKSIIGEVKDGNFIPYKDRKIIDMGALNDKALELVWLKDPVDAFFMHIQGSGVIRYENGTRKTFGYAGKNGKAYHAIGKFLIKSGEIKKEDMSMQAIRRWIKDNPLQAESLMWKNPSYVFFRPLENEAPIGAMGVELTAGRSLAIDRAYVPLGMPVWLDLAPSLSDADPIRRLVIAQDTGGAIKGRVRADVYWGIGDDAGLMAGTMKDQGRYYFLLPKTLGARITAEQGLFP